IVTALRNTEALGPEILTLRPWRWQAGDGRDRRNAHPNQRNSWDAGLVEQPRRLGAGSMRNRMDHTQPLVSIGIPTYNRGSLLHRSIDSALNQDFENIEIVISDNASTDETPQVCLSYAAKDRRIKYIRQTTNLGPTTNFNEVLKHASGVFFMWLGDDDWIDTSYVRTCVER